MTPAGRLAGLQSKSPLLHVWSSEPLLIETPLELLREAVVTPTELFFVRNHGPIPAVAETHAYRVSVEGLIDQPLRLSLRDLQHSFPQAEIEATLVCAGNRRAELDAARPIPGETPWDAGAIGNGVWTGVRLCDVLAAAGIGIGARHVAFTGLDSSAEADEFGASIPLEKALEPDVLLAYAMNGEPLSPAHGFPLRIVVPGYIGARSVKWLSAISVQAEPSSNYFQAHGYRLHGAALAELSLNSVVCRTRLEERTARVEGFALAGGGRSVERVEVSVDRGENWVAATLAPSRGRWGWRFWHADTELEPGAPEVVVRAFDSAGNAQPADAAALWNAKGYANNAWHRAALTR